jgi:hypothetical protein
MEIKLILLPSNAFDIGSFDVVFIVLMAEFTALCVNYALTD